MSNSERRAIRCATHDDIGWKYSDGSIGCLTAANLEGWTTPDDCTDGGSIPTDWIAR